MNTKQSRSAADAANEAYANATALAAEPEGGASDSPDDVVTVKASQDEAHRLALETEAVLAGLLGAPADNDGAREPTTELARSHEDDAGSMHTPPADELELRDALARASLPKGTMPDVSRLVLAPETSLSPRERGRTAGTPGRRWFAGSLLVVAAVAVGSLTVRLPEQISARPLDTQASAASTRDRALVPTTQAGPASASESAPPAGRSATAPAAPDVLSGAQSPVIDVAPAPVADDAPAPVANDAPAPVADEAPSPAAADALPTGDASDLLKRAEQLLRKDRGASAAGEARALLMGSIAQQNDNPHAHAALAEACLRLRDAPCARAAVARAVRLRPKREAYVTLESKIEDAFETR